MTDAKTKGTQQMSDQSLTTLLLRALKIACRRIADGPQEYHEATTPEGWEERFLAEAKETK